MISRNFVQTWKSLTPEQKKKLCVKADVTETHMRSIVSYLNTGKRGVGRRTARDIALALHQLGYIEGDKKSALSSMFSNPETEAA